VTKGEDKGSFTPKLEKKNKKTNEKQMGGDHKTDPV